eukprot:CAMPEP_0177180178 /NCGR_PEP_ID=MMETSP0367-20130122/15255_1 /TAXON_ID=447022 ORGANISM="Scrippsiella hangoei-like, Strain SHHI-4" /NCGR_SAMPLE_ID=MMETSP0367 /ASSEMBLY_ACC=CAM_ASM_000362 /LENGTH=690 /DNA_ID=CAMNT_0018626949 /DNA_START=56 /DNA_END=2128 /DNA_ORIENTATION=+
MMKGPLALTVGLLAACGWRAQAAAVTPVEKVIELLSKLQVQVEQEGKDEATAYDKYACFCKEEVSDKLYAIEKSDAKIKKLDAKIELLSSEITTLDSEIADLGREIDSLSEKMKLAKEKREGEHAIFVEELADVDGAISACERALVALKESKGNLGGKSELEASLAQIKVLATRILGDQPGKAFEYTYHANDIIATIEALLKKFTDKKNQVEQDEFDTNSAFEMRQLSYASEKKFAEKEKMEKEQLAEMKREEKAATEADRTQEISEKNTDQSFMDVLTADCETKAHLWDQRSTTRAAEIKAMADAQTALREGVAPNWQSNKKLVGLQTSKSASKGHWVYVEDAAPAPRSASFLQLHRSSGKRASARGSLSKAISQMLMKAAEDLKSPMLSAAALKVSVTEDHFVKVRQIIKDLVAKLQSEAESEQTQKSFCDKEMKAAVTSRDEEQGKVEDLMAQITAKESAKAQLKQEIATLSQQIAENTRALMEATELRDAESKENLKTIDEAGAGKEAVTQAIEVLKVFYEGAAFVQQKFVPTDSDREGLTVADKAPEVFDTEYKGSQEASKGIVGMLEVILSDFDRTVSTVTGEEKDSQEAFETFKSENEADTLTKEKAVETKEGEVATIEDELVSLSDSLKTAQTSLGLALGELEKLHSMCVEGEETYEGRVAKRQKEIDALREAHDILENWQA